MIKKIILCVIGFSIFTSMTITPSVVSAVNIYEACNKNNNNVCAAKNTDNVNNLIKVIINTLLWAVGILSVVYLIYGGIKYTTSAGDPNKITAAKNTITYSLVGLVVAIFAYTIVNFVVDQISSTDNESSATNQSTSGSSAKNTR